MERNMEKASLISPLTMLSIREIICETLNLDMGNMKSRIIAIKGSGKMTPNEGLVLRQLEAQ